MGALPSTCRRRQRLSLRKVKSNKKASFVVIVAAFFVVAIVGVWVCLLFSTVSRSPQQPHFHQRERRVRGGIGSSRKENGRPKLGGDERSLQHKHKNHGREQSGSRYSWKPRVVGIYAYQLNESDDWNIKREDRNRETPSYMFLTERIDPYLLSHASQTLRRMRFHDYIPDDLSLSETVKNYRRAIAGSNSRIKSEDPLRHLMLSSNSRDTLKDIRDDSDDYEAAMATPLEDEECEATPKNARWMLHSFPTCNFLHENDWETSVRRATTKILGSGYWRDVWPVLDAEPSWLARRRKVALKTLRYEHDIDERNFHRHVRDAIVSERMTWSPLVTDIYAFCGNSGYFEFATGGSLNDRLQQHYVAKVNAESNEAMGRHDKNDDDNEVLDQRTKLSLAHQVAAGLADFHNTDAMRDKNGEVTSAAIVHADITTDQFINVDGIYKLNDFNRCRFMRRYRNSSNFGGDGKPCGFKVGNNPANNRSPEEYAYEVETEKVDIYSMGNIFYTLLTGMDAWEGKSEKTAQEAVMAGERPHVPPSIMSSEDLVDKALREVMYQCWEHKPEERPRAVAVANYLSEKLSQLEKENGANIE